MEWEKIKEADKLMREGKNGKAVTFIKGALKESPEEVYFYYLLGIARMKCGRLFLAKKALLKANELDPRHAENLRSLGWVKVMLDEIEDGRKDLREAISLDLMNPLAYLDLAMSYFNYFDFKEGMEWLNRAIALAPKDTFVLKNFEIAREMQEKFSKVSEKQLEKMKKEKSDPKMQKAFRIVLLEKYSRQVCLTKDEAEEIKEESRFNGVSASIITDKEQDFIALKNKSGAFKNKEILEKRKEIEKEFIKMLKEIKSSFSLEYIKNVIYNEEDDDDLMKIISIFDNGQGAGEMENIFDLINDAWNYFPHKCLTGLCPMEKIIKENKNRRI